MFFFGSVSNDDKTQPFSIWQEVDVVFPAAPNTDVIVLHNMAALDPNAVNYTPIRKDRAADVYHDTSVTRKAWQGGYIVLRSNVASARMTLLLYVSHSQRTLVF